MKKILAFLGLVLLTLSLWAGTPRSFKDSLSADGPYILYGSGGAEVIAVDVKGNISRQQFSKLPEGYRFKVTDHRGKYPFEVRLRPVARAAWQQKDTPARTFVMSDPHGRLDCVIDLLQGNQVIDARLHWAYGTDRLVVIGDITDRGKDATAIYWFFYKLQQEAADAGGSVVMLLGNHEPMEFAGDMRYAEPKYKILARELGMEYASLIGPDTELGRWIATWNTVNILGRDLYVHAGIGKDFYDWNLPLPEVNEKVSRTLFMLNRGRKAIGDTAAFLHGSYGPLWYRGLVSKEAKRRPVSVDTLDLIRARYNVDHIIVGHTIFPNVSTFYEGRVIDVNVNNPENRKKHRSRALLIENGRYYSVTDQGKRQELPAPVPTSLVPAGRQNWNRDWTFTKDGQSRVLTLPHDWGVEQPFRQENPGETGKLAWWGQATYSKRLEIGAKDLAHRLRLEVDGAFSNAKVYVNGAEAGGWPYGYASWAVELNPWLKEGENLIEIKLDNKPESSRWYPGGGIYRNVWLTRQAKTSVAHWGTYVTTDVREENTRVHQHVTVRTDKPQVACLVTRILYKEEQPGKLIEHVVAETRSFEEISDGCTVTQDFTVENPRLWSVDHPQMYLARTVVVAQDGTEDVYETPFGIRSAQWRPEGFFLNGEKTFLKGVCLHHDAGVLGAVWNDDAWVRRLTMLKRMGCNAIRTSHNPPAPELLDLCDRMGFLVLDELTDTWTWPKKENGYATLFNDWARKDLVALIHRDRNHPSVIAWSIGNECGEQGDSTRWWIPRMLTDICHREDPTRPTTAGNDNPLAASQPYAGTIDVYGFNYKPHLYAQFRDSHPGQPFYGSETASCISSRGYYLFPVSEEKGKGWKEEYPFQVSSFDLYAPLWASKPDYEWGFEDQVPECAGEFVWTGYDYLGEPTPFNLDPSVLSNFHTEEEKEAYRKLVAGWGQTISEVPLPSRSSYFGIMDLAGFPKDRFYLYQSRWAPETPMAHILPHWTWPGREGELTPVHVYTSGDEAELFLNGKSLGRKAREGYRIVWDNVVYTPGTLKVVAYKDGKEWATDQVNTAGKASRIAASVDYEGDELVYITADVLDKAGNLVPDADNTLSFSVKGPAQIIGTDAGDPTSFVPFYSTTLPAFHGKASAIVRRTGKGPVTVTVTGNGLKKGICVLQ